MSGTFLTDKQLAGRYGVHRATVWRWVKVDPHFPKPVVFSPGCTRFRLDDIIAWEQVKENGQ